MRIIWIAALSLPLAFSQARIEGTVVNSLTGAPVRKVEVSIDNRDGDKHYSVDTTADGKFVIENIAPGEYRMTAKRFGFIEKKGDDLHLDAKSDLKEIIVKLAPGGLVAGRVVDEDGDPLPLSGVELAGNVLATDAEGHFIFAGLKPGRHKLIATAFFTPWGDTSEIYPPVEYAFPIVITPGSEQRNIEIRMHRERAYKIQGRLAEAPPRPLQLTLVSAEPNVEPDRVETAPDGSFQFSGVVAGSYFIRVDRGPVFISTSGNSFPRNSPGYCNFPIAVSHDVHDLIVPLGPPATVIATLDVHRLSPENSSDVALRLDPQATEPVRQQDGTVLFTNLAWADYAVRVEHPYGSYVQSIRFNGVDVTQAAHINLNDGGTGSLNVVVAPNAAEIAVRRIPGAQIHLWVGDGDDFGGSVDQHTESVFTNLAPGEYHLLATENGIDFDPQDPETRKALADFITTIRVSENEHAHVELKAVSQ